MAEPTLTYNVEHESVTARFPSGNVITWGGVPVQVWQMVQEARQPVRVLMAGEFPVKEAHYEAIHRA